MLADWYGRLAQIIICAINDQFVSSPAVAPSRVRGLKLCQGATFDIATTSHPHECVDCNAGTLLYVAYLQFVMDRKEEKE